MRKVHILAFTTLCFSLICSPVAFSLPAQAQSTLSLQALEQGQVDIQLIKSSAQHYIQAQGIFDAPPDKVWRALTDFKNYPRYYESIVKSEIRSQQGNQAQVYVKFNFPFPLEDLWVLNQYTLDPVNRRLSWKMLEGNLKDSDGSGSWTLSAHKGKTLGTYRLNVRSSGAAQWVQNQAIFRTTPAVFKYLNRQIR